MLRLLSIKDPSLSVNVVRPDSEYGDGGVNDEVDPARPSQSSTTPAERGHESGGNVGLVKVNGTFAPPNPWPEIAPAPVDVPDADNAAESVMGPAGMVKSSELTSTVMEPDPAPTLLMNRLVLLTAASPGVPGLFEAALETAISNPSTTTPVTTSVFVPFV